MCLPSWLLVRFYLAFFSFCRQETWLQKSSLLFISAFVFIPCLIFFYLEAFFLKFLIWLCCLNLQLVFAIEFPDSKYLSSSSHNYMYKVYTYSTSLIHKPPKYLKQRSKKKFRFFFIPLQSYWLFKSRSYCLF